MNQTNFTPPGGDQSLWEIDGEKSRGMQKVVKSMTKLGMPTGVGVMRREYGPDLTPLQKAWKPVKK